MKKLFVVAFSLTLTGAGYYYVYDLSQLGPLPEVLPLTELTDSNSNVFTNYEIRSGGVGHGVYVMYATTSVSYRLEQSVDTILRPVEIRQPMIRICDGDQIGNVCVER